MRLRPSRSPKWPKIAAPSGLAKNPTAKVLNEAIKASNGSTPGGKNTEGNTSAAAVPKIKKS